MAKDDDLVLASVNFITKHSLSITMVVLCLFMFLLYSVINNVNYEEPEYKVDKIAIMQKSSKKYFKLKKIDLINNYVNNSIDKHDYSCKVFYLR